MSFDDLIRVISVGHQSCSNYNRMFMVSTIGGCSMGFVLMTHIFGIPMSTVFASLGMTLAQNGSSKE